MTERWRKRLEHLDKESPSDEVFDRAHQGPRLPDAPIGMPSTSTRVVTAIAAFAVFALAISVFAIPVLRLRDQPGDAGQPLLPLWPVRTLDDVESLQAKNDSAPQGLQIPGVQVLRSPETTAAAFGQQVMGWDDPHVLELDEGWGAYVEPSIVTSGPIAYGDPLCRLTHSAGSTPAVACDGGYATPVPADSSDVVFGPGPSAGSPTSSPAASPFRKIAVYEFDPGLVATGNTSPWLEQAAVTLTLFQPLGTPEGNVWTVLDVEGSSVGMPLAAGSTVVAGEVIEVPFGWDEQQVAAGVHIGASDDCDVTTNDVEFRHQTIRLRVTVPEGSSCRGTVPGYVYAAVDLGDPIGLNDDPIARGSADGLHALSAVPVLVRIPEAPSSVSPTGEPTSRPTDDPTAEPSEPTTYTDPLGWSIDVPPGWSSQAFDEFNGRYTVSGAWFSSGHVDVVPGVAELPDQPVPADGEVMVKIWNRQGGPLDLPQDSSFVPFMSEALRVALGELIDGTFTADGLTYSFRVQHGEGAPTQAQIGALKGMVASMSFEPWSEGETRRGWTSLGRIEVDPDSAVSITRLATGAAYTDEAGTVVLQTYVAAACGSPEWRFYADAIAVSCADGTEAAFDIDGAPLPSNPPEFQEPLSATSGILSWDGHVLIAA